MRIVILDEELVNPGDLSLEPLQALGSVEAHPFTRAVHTAAAIGNAEAVLTNRVAVGRRELEQCPNLRYIGTFSTGYNGIDLGAASEHGVVVCNVPNYCTDAVAQHTMALLLALTNHVAQQSSAVHQGLWNSDCAAFLPYSLHELTGKSFGVIGFGNIGRATGRVAAALGMRVLASGSHPAPEGLAIAEYLPLYELLAQSDVVSLHCPLLPATRGMINAASLAVMRPGALLLNTARGALVDEGALAAALHSGHLAGAGLDVTDPEPLDAASPLATAPNCFITPHRAWSAIETRRRLLAQVTENLRAWQAGAPQNVVNPQVLPKR